MWDQVSPEKAIKGDIGNSMPIWIYLYLANATSSGGFIVLLVIYAIVYVLSIIGRDTYKQWRGKDRGDKLVKNMRKWPAIPILFYAFVAWVVVLPLMLHSFYSIINHIIKTQETQIIAGILATVMGLTLFYRVLLVLFSRKNILKITWQTAIV